MSLITVDDHSCIVLSQEKYIVGEDYMNASFIDVCILCLLQAYHYNYINRVMGKRKLLLSLKGQ